MNVIPITCCEKGCGYSPFPMDRGFYERALETHELWHCPAGHPQRFVGETAKDREHRLEVAKLRAAIKDWKHHWQKAHDLARTCPWPTCREFVYSSRDSLYEHMRRSHGMPTVTLVREAS